MSKHRKTPEGARADQRWETDGGATPPEQVADAGRTPGSSAAERRERRWQTANDRHWHHAGYSDDTKRRQIKD